MVFRKVLDVLSLRAVRNRLDKRKLQEELDLHRLFLLTSAHSRWQQGTNLHAASEGVAAALDAEARQLGPAGLKAAVAASLSRQIVDAVQSLHATVSSPQVDDAAPARSLAAAQSVTPPSTDQQAPPLSGLGAAMAAGESTPSSLDSSLPQQPSCHVPFSQISDAFLSAAGFSLHVQPSTVGHSEAGDGLFIRGGVGIGQLVALYPGIAYPPLYHRNIPGYPLIARSNPFLLSRFDGVVFDAKPWGRGREAGPTPWLAEQPQNDAEAALGWLEGRHPMALAHWANHPPAGTAPNVVVAALDWDPTLLGLREDLTLRAYVPVIEFAPEGASSTFPPGSKTPVPCVALVALRPLLNEEIFLNYRLNPNAPGGLPPWYVPVDKEEDERRWK